MDMRLTIMAKEPGVNIHNVSGTRSIRLGSEWGHSHLPVSERAEG